MNIGLWFKPFIDWRILSNWILTSQNLNTTYLISILFDGIFLLYFLWKFRTSWYTYLILIYMESKIPSIDSGEQFKNPLLSSPYWDTFNSTFSVLPVPSLSFLIKSSPKKYDRKRFSEIGSFCRQPHYGKKSEVISFWVRRFRSSLLLN